MEVRGCAVIFSLSLDLYQRGLLAAKRRKEGSRSEEKQKRESNKVTT